MCKRFSYIVSFCAILFAALTPNELQAETPNETPNETQVETPSEETDVLCCLKNVHIRKSALKNVSSKRFVSRNQHRSSVWDREMFDPEKCYDLRGVGVNGRCQTGWSRCERKREIRFRWLDQSSIICSRGASAVFHVGFETHSI